MIKYYPIELHSHTIHSDGDFKISELEKYMKKFGYKGAFLTDHNTTSGYSEVSDREFLFPGIEWSTFYGHLTILGEDKNLDFTLVDKNNLEEILINLKKKYNIVSGAAHPGIISGEICPGCDFTFNIKDWKNLDYIEISNGDDAYMVYWTEESYKFWIDKLKKGVRIPAVSGRDLHRPNPYNSIFTLTMIGVENEFSKIEVIEGIRKGRTYITLGPEIVLKNLEFGEEIKSGRNYISYKINKLNIPGIKPQLSEIEKMKIRFINNEKIIEEKHIKWDSEDFVELDLNSGYLRVEIVSDLREVKNMKILISSPIYVK